MTRRTPPERIAALEVHVEQLLEDGLRREEKQDEILTEIRKLRELHDAQKSELDRYKGFFGGAIWCLTAMGFVVMKFAAPIYAWVMRIKTGSP